MEETLKTFRINMGQRYKIFRKKEKKKRVCVIQYNEIREKK